jgi:hypothetical protein
MSAGSNTRQAAHETAPWNQQMDSLDYFFSLDTLSLRPLVTQMLAPSEVT